MKVLFILLFVVFSRAKHVKVRSGPGYDCEFCQPEQVHISFGSKTNDIVVTWSTFNDTIESRAQYGVNEMDKEALGHSKLFTDGGPEKRSQWIHRVLLKDLKHDTRYVYHVGSEYGWSEDFWFKTPPVGEDWVVRAAIFGDMGNKNAHSLSYLQDEAQRGHFDVVLHVGDFAYDMHDEGARVGDQFMRQIQPLAAHVPYMACPGNHEEAYNFSNYRARFSMPGAHESLYYSFDLGPVHFVSISTELYYFLQYGLKVLEGQFRWLQRDLAEANKEKNRRTRPWIVLYSHRPMYCSNDHQLCWNNYLPNRVGLPLLGLGLEPLLKEYGVDLVIWAHEHSYERLWPVYDEKVYNGSLEQPYTNPGAPVHIVTGSAGCQERTDPFKPNPPSWSAFRSTDYGYTRFRAHNRTHLYMEQVRPGKYRDLAEDRREVEVFNYPVRLESEVAGTRFIKRAPVHLITGSAGCQEGRDHFKRNPNKWSAFRSQDYGYTRFKTFNRTHISIEQVSVDLGGQVIDKFWLIKDRQLKN